jgi:flagellar basal-body rod protein FlgB
MRIEAGVTQEMGISFQQALGVHPQAVKLRLERTELLTANLANVDTPNFKAKDIDLQRANNAAVDVQYRVPMQPSEDGNTVELNSEQARFSQNSMDYQSSLTFLNLQISGIREGIEGK